LYGDIKPGSYVQLWETGGYAHPIDIINNFSNELDRKVFRESFYSTWTDEELETKYRADVQRDIIILKSVTGLCIV
jgi:hypothetical protein